MGFPELADDVVGFPELADDVVGLLARGNRMRDPGCISLGLANCGFCHMMPSTVVSLELAMLGKESSDLTV